MAKSLTTTQTKFACDLNEAQFILAFPEQVGGGRETWFTRGRRASGRSSG